MPPVAVAEGTRRLFDYGALGIVCAMFVVVIIVLYNKSNKDQAELKTLNSQLASLVSANLQAMEGMSENLRHLVEAVEERLKIAGRSRRRK